jgi:xylan 1,4-beta-xylosidase
MNFKNPILSGMYPDPSICRRGEDYFLVTSGFEYFPALPIFHSKDLVHWEQIGHGIDRVEQTPIDVTVASGQAGTYAPTIRYHDGWFYLICTLIRTQGKSGNFLLKTQDPFKGWGDPIWIPIPGIDPTIVWDDKKVYITASRYEAKPGVDWHTIVYLQEVDAQTYQPIGEMIDLTDGALHNATAAEAPHIYERNGFYYLIVAEGGTGHHHAVTVFRSNQIEGPYKVAGANPILTHRHLGQDYPIVGTGHADFVETQNGEFWMVCLAMRPYGGYHYNLGRETFLVPMTWENGWPIISKGHGKVLDEYPVPDLPPGKPAAVKPPWTSAGLGLEWNFLRSPRETWWSLTERPGSLSMKLLPAKLSEYEPVAFVGRRQQHMNFQCSVVMDCTPGAEDTVGMTVLYSDDFHFRFVRTASKIQLIKRERGDDSTVAEAAYTGATIALQISAVGQDYSFSYGANAQSLKVLAKEDGHMLSAATAGGFVGTYVGLYGSSNGATSTNKAYFKDFVYQGKS